MVSTDPAAGQIRKGRGPSNCEDAAVQQLRRRRGLAPLPPGHRRGAVLGTVLTLVLAAFAWWVVFSPGVLTTGSHATVVRGIAIGIGCLFGVRGLLGAWACLAGGNRVPRWTADSEGIALWSLVGSVEVPWADVRAIGVGYQRSPRISSMVRPKQDEAIEIFLVQPDPGRRYPR